jgi:hypothetical protein
MFTFERMNIFYEHYATLSTRIPAGRWRSLRVVTEG